MAEERCEGCGFVWAAISPANLPSGVDRAVGDFTNRLFDVDEDDVAISLAVGQWSVAEYAGHVRDVLLTSRDRIVIALVEDTPSLVPMYRDERVALGLYARDWDRGELAEEIGVAGRLFTRFIRKLDETQLRRTVQYSYPAPAVRDLLWLGAQVLHEIEHHGKDIVAIDEVLRER